MFHAHDSFETDLTLSQRECNVEALKTDISNIGSFRCKLIKDRPYLTLNTMKVSNDPNDIYL